MLHQLLRYSLSASLILLLVACAGTSHYQSNWPARLPELGYYQQIYQQDESNRAIQSEQDYLKWVKRFYFGWVLYPNGWHWLTDNALDKAANARERAMLVERLGLIGERVSAEWAKDSSYRVINTSHLMTWGNALELALKKGEADRLTAAVLLDIDQLLGGALQPDEIDFDRYFPENQAVIAHDNTTFDPFDA